MNKESDAAAVMLNKAHAALAKVEGERDALRNGLKQGRDRDHFIAGLLGEIDRLTVDLVTVTEERDEAEELIRHRWAKGWLPVGYPNDTPQWMGRTGNGEVVYEPMSRARAEWLASVVDGHRSKANDNDATKRERSAGEPSA